MSNLPKLPDLGQFFGDTGGPGGVNPQTGQIQTDAQKTCPFADQQTGEFCSLDGAMCPFVGFNYRRCRKYTNNMAKGMSKAMDPQANNSTSSTPRVESSRALPIIQEMIKKGGPIVEKKDDDADAIAFHRRQKARDIADIKRTANDPGADDGWQETNDRAGDVDPEGHRYHFEGDVDDPFAEVDKDIDAQADDWRDELAREDEEIRKMEAKAKKKQAEKSRRSAQQTGKKPSKPRKKKEEKVEVPAAASSKGTPSLSGFDPDSIPASAVPIEVKQAAEAFALRAKAGHSEADIAGITDEFKEFLQTTGGQHLEIYYNDQDPQYTGMQQVAKYFAAYAHQVHNVNPKVARGFGETMAHISAVAAGEVVRSSDAYSRDAAHAQDHAAGFGGGTIFTDPGVNADLPKGSPTTSDPEDIGADKPGTLQFPKGTKFELADKKTLAQWRIGMGQSNLPTSTVAQGLPKPTGGTVTGRPRIGPRIFGVSNDAPAEETPAKEKEEPKKKTKYTGSDKSYAKETSTSMNYEQFVKFLETEVSPLSTEEKKHVFAGRKGTFGDIEANFMRLADEAAQTKNFAGIARMRQDLSDRIKNVRDIAENRRKLDLQWKQGLDTLKKYPIGDRKAYEMAIRKLGQDDQAKGKVAKFVNKFNDNVFRLKMRTMKIGNADMVEFYREMTLPRFEKKDFEVMRMTQQLGLQAIHMHHQYGRGYGRWNTLMGVVKNILMWSAWALTKDEKIPSAILSMWPQAELDGLYFNFIKKYLPKEKLQVSKDTKFMRSRKMRSGRAARIMRGFDKDNVLPPDQAVMHTRWYPTTKETWGKRRQKELVARYQAAKALPAGQGPATFKTFLRR